MIKYSRTTARFDRSLKKLSKKHYDLARLDTAIKTILAEDHETLIRQFDWHMLTGNLVGINEIHVDKNWLLLYQIINDDELTLLLLNTGGHNIL
ncbi:MULTISPECIES: type II toxin-antitoxin system mRNA interferase toxin, RelE/StbE family [Lactobacillaceae]|uniref:type II toxin-antitoxin system RelE/ParE family toxin n=1 Tax=Lactobacillaceae TaxID=33958 RepID=UPI0014573753|nr:type II toxin-antitoxin system mRNA interferase toxin, RelE/StbE family [Lactobacillus sp. HBUAS51381]NLR10121.1 type II toxin-antitoxin system mRNA interferase toxin, RelE/StbE family [Lactobacillus sp. HBUAS51381]